MDNTIQFNPEDLDGMCALMDAYGDSEQAMWGTNERGEDTMMSISPNEIVVRTFQSNGFCRINVYYRDGDTEEYFER